MPDPQTYSLPTFASAMGGIPYAPVAIPQVYSAAPVAGAQAPIEPFTLSRLGGLAQGSLEQAFGNIRYGLPAAVGGLLGGLSPEQAAADKAGLDYWNQKAAAAAPGGPATFGDVISGRVNPVRALAENAATLPGALASMLGGAAIGLRAGPIGGIAGATAGAFGGQALSSLAENAARSLQETGGVSEGQALRGAAVAPAQAAALMYGAKFIPGLSGLVGGAAETGATALGRVVSGAFHGAVANAVGAVTQSAGERFAAGIPLTSPEALHEFVQSFGTAAMVGGALGGLHGLAGKATTPVDTKPPTDVSNDDLAGVVDQSLAPPVPPAAPGGPPPSEPVQAQSEPAPAAPAASSSVAPEVQPGPTEPSAPGAVSEQQIGAWRDMLSDASNLSLLKGLNDMTGGASSLPPVVSTLIHDELAQRGVDVGQDEQGTFFGKNLIETRVPEPPAGEPGFEQQKAGWTAGLRDSQFLRGLNAITTPEEAEAHVYDAAIVDPNPTKGATQVAQRMGLLDEDGKPTQRAGQIEAQRAAADQELENQRQAGMEFGQWWGENVRSNRDFTGAREIKELNPTDRADAENKVFSLLADNVEPNAAPAEGTSGKDLTRWKFRLKAAQALGLTDADGNWTEKGIEVAQRQPVPTEEAVDAAQKQGFTGGLASVFDRGVQGEDVKSFNGFDEMRAFEAGKLYRENRVQDIQEAMQRTKGDALTDAFLRDQLADKQGKTAVTVVDKRANLLPEQLDQQASMNAIEHLNLPDTRGADKAALIDMVRNGRSPEDVRQAVETIQNGGSILDPAQAAPKWEFKPVQPVRGQPKFVELNQGEGKTFPLKQEGAENNWGDAPAQHVAEFQQAIEGKSLSDAVRVAAGYQTDPEIKTLAGRVAATLDKLQAEHGTQFDLKIAHSGDDVPEPLTNARGVTDHVGNRATVWLNGGDVTGKVGVDANTALHEATHAALGAAIETGSRPEFAGTQIGKAVRDLSGVFQYVKDALDRKQAGGGALSPFEAEIAEGRNNALDNVHELMAWTAGSDEMRSMLKGIDYNPKLSVWDKLVDTVRQLFGLAPKYKTALDTVMSAGNRLMDAPSAEHGSSLRAMTDLNTPMRGQSGVAPRTPADTNAFTQDAARVVTNLKDRLLSSTSLLDKTMDVTRPSRLKMSSLFNVARWYEKSMPSVMKLFNRNTKTDATVESLSRVASQAHQKLLTLATEAKARGVDLIPMVNKLMNMSAMHGIDPYKVWDQQPWLHEEPNAGRLRVLVNESNKMVQDLKAAGYLQAYENYRSLNEGFNHAVMAVEMYNHIMGNAEYRELTEQVGGNPMNAYLDNRNLHEDAGAFRDYWAGVQDNLTRLAQGYRDHLRGTVQGDKVASKDVETRLKPLEQMLAKNAVGLSRMAEKPYFHLGREGDHFASAVLRKTDTGVVDPLAIEALGRELSGLKLDSYLLSADNKNASFYIRLKNPEQRVAVEQALMRLKAQGFLGKDSEGKDAEILAGPRSADNNRGVNSAEVKAIQRMIGIFEASRFRKADLAGLSDEEKNRLYNLEQSQRANMQAAMIDLLPDNANIKVMQTKHGVQGASADMVQGFAKRWVTGINALVRQAAEPEVQGIMGEMHDQVQQARVVGSAQHGQVDALNDAYNEVVTREMDRSNQQRTPGWDAMRAFTNLFYLGLQPAFVTVHLSQLGSLLWPELAKYTSYVDAAKAIAKVTPTAFNVMRATFNEALKVGWDHAADMVITEDILKGVKGLSDAQRTHLLKMMQLGIIDIGAAAREQGRVADPNASKWSNNVMRWGSATALYTETMTRVIAGLAAHDVYKGKGDPVDFASRITTEAMLAYQNWNVARAMGKRGWFGPFTPVMTQFMQYSAQVTEKMFRELHTAFLDRSADPEERSQARRFLAGNAVAMVALCGSLGLPFATPAAAAVKKLEDVFGEPGQPHDPLASWHNFLVDTFGDGMGNALARGIPHALGADMSDRLGEANLIPFSSEFAEFLTDQRKTGDIAKDLALKSYGAPISMLTSMADGLEKIRMGNALGGMAEMLPSVMKNPIKAYQMSKYGYTDARGNPLPIAKPDGAAEVLQAMGFLPSAKALYNEQEDVKSEREQYMQLHRQRLTNNIVLAMERGDSDAARQHIADAQAFDKGNPGYMVLPGLGGAVQSRMQSIAMARALGTPTGTPVRDITGRQELQFAKSIYAPGQ